MINLYVYSTMKKKKDDKKIWGWGKTYQVIQFLIVSFFSFIPKQNNTYTLYGSPKWEQYIN